MAKQTLNCPAYPHMPPNTGDSPELGDGWDATLAKLNAMMTDLYAEVGASEQAAAFNTNNATASATLTAANVTGGNASVDLALTGALGAAANAQLPTVASMIAAMNNAAAGDSFRLRIINESSGAFAWTVTTNTGWTLTGTMTIAQNTWREFVVTIGANSTATLQNVAVGTFS